MAPTGQTADGTWQLGVRRTIAGFSVEEAWATGLELIAEDDAASEATSLTDLVVARFQYTQAGWDRHAILQLRVSDAAGGATIAIHLEKLPDEAAREGLLTTWTERLEGLQPAGDAQAD